MGYIKIYPASYSRCITLGANSSGVCISILLPFRPFHAPIFIPFEDLSGAQRKRWFFSLVELQAKQNPGVTIMITKGQADWIKAASDNIWSYELLKPV